MRVRYHAARNTAVLDSEGKRHCAACGDYIDPKDWCSSCRVGQPCRYHRRPVLRSDAAFCNASCRSWQRSTGISAARSGRAA